MADTPTTTPTQPAPSTRPASPEAVGVADAERAKGADFASQIDALLADVKSANEELQSAVSDDPASAMDGRDGASIEEQLDHLVASLPTHPTLANGPVDVIDHTDHTDHADHADHADHVDPVDHAAEALDSDLAAPKTARAAGTHAESLSMKTPIVADDTNHETFDAAKVASGQNPEMSGAPLNDIASQVSDLLASLPGVIGDPEPEPTAPEETVSTPSTPNNGAARPSASEADEVAEYGTDESIDEQIAILTSCLIRSESPTTEKLSEMISPDPSPSGRVASGASATSAEPTPHQILRYEDPATPRDTAAAEADSLLAEQVKGPPISARLAAALAPVGVAVSNGLGSGAELLAAPLAKYPGLAKGLGWISLNTIFLAGCLWAFLIFVRLPAIENVKASSFDFSHGTLPAPTPVHAAARGEGDGHGESADGHGEKAATKDDGGHGAKKTPAKKESTKKAPKKKEPAKKDAKPASGAH